MSVPVISPTQSVLGYQQWEYFEFQPFATGNPFRWRLNNPLPTGLALDAPPVHDITGDSGTDVISCDGADIVEGSQVVIWSKSGGSGVAVETIYFARDVVTETSFKLAAAPGGAVVPLGTNITSGTLSLKPTGKISGAAEVPGVWVFGLVAENGDGESAEQEFTIGIEPGALVPDSLPWISVDVVTGQIRVDGAPVPPLTAALLEKLADPASYDELPVALTVKEGDDLLARISFARGSAVQDINLEALRLVIKQYEPEAALVVSSEAFAKKGSGSGTNFLLHAKFDGAALAATLSDYETDQGTYFLALAELECEQVNPEEDVGPATLIRSSATFLLRIERDLADNVES